MIRWFPELEYLVKVHLIEASERLLGPFNIELQTYAEKLLRNRKFDVKTGVSVKEVRPGEIELRDGEIMKCGIVIWSTGVAPTKFISSL